jgi:diaminopimelate decarboxylase
LLGDAFYYKDRVLYCEDVPLERIAARAGTPVYVYSTRGIVTPFRAYVSAFGDLAHRVCYAVKANSNLAVLRLLASEGAGFDIVSGGELYRVLRAGASPEKVVFSGVGKTAAEIEYAIEEGIDSFNCESDAELALIDALAARLGKRARVSLRVNPDIEAQTHPYISTGLREHKFGIDMAEAEGIYQRAAALPNLIVDGVSCHIGSQLLDTDPIWQAAERVLELVDRLRGAGIAIRRLDLGGGLGVAYKSGDVAPAIEKFISGVVKRVRGRNLEIMIEPGRSIVGSAGILLTRVLYRKKTERKEFVVVDAAMNDLIRPALYQSHHEIVPLNEAPERGVITADVVGPVCETGDFLARNREIANVLPGDLLAVCTAGAYGFVLASNYNSRPRPAEVLVEGGSWRVVRERETYADLVRGE